MWRLVADSAEEAGFDVSVGDLKDPVRVHEKAVDDYAKRFPPPDPVPPEACVTDVLRARLICKNGAAMVKLVKLLTGAMVEVSLAGNGGKGQLECIRLKNKYRPQDLDPTHFRNCLLNMRFFCGNASCFAEIQIHHAAIYEYNEESHAHAHYEYFRSELAAKYDKDRREPKGGLLKGGLQFYVFPQNDVSPFVSIHCVPKCVCWKTRLINNPFFISPPLAPPERS